jgi:hypothetical protein
MKSVATITLIVLCAVIVLGILIGLQQIISYQAQIALNEFNMVHKAQRELDLDTSSQTSLSETP